ncbi:hypothetical protein [Desulfotomaculum sp. 1211_IL3151]|uniref:hypothetical protein n=1 Tax=Desulfotomaculum sp. 1211_IL3151 TaxID=3084055 RepID=UPI002FD9DEC5
MKTKKINPDLIDSLLIIIGFSRLIRKKVISEFSKDLTADITMEIEKHAYTVLRSLETEEYKKSNLM